MTTMMATLMTTSTVCTRYVHVLARHEGGHGELRLINSIEIYN